MLWADEPPTPESTSSNSSVQAVFFSARATLIASYILDYSTPDADL